jgi:hypothetical protein
MAKWMRCHAQLNVQVGTRTEYLQPGMVVNVERELAPGLTMAEALGHHLDGFTEVSAPDASAVSEQE